MHTGDIPEMHTKKGPQQRGSPHMRAGVPSSCALGAQEHQLGRATELLSLT